MNACKLIVLCFLIIAMSCKKAELVRTGVIPQPNEMNYQKGSFAIGEKTAIVVANSEDGQRIANDLHAFLRYPSDEVHIGKTSKCL